MLKTKDDDPVFMKHSLRFCFILRPRPVTTTNFLVAEIINNLILGPFYATLDVFTHVPKSKSIFNFKSI